jgi:hypothetical protein
MELSISKFDPLKAEISALVENVKTTVASASGAAGYDLMKENKRVLQQRRTDLVRGLKAERESAIKFQKAIIEVEKDCLKLIADVEDPLDEKIKTIDDSRKREERLAILPERKEKLLSIELELTDDEILDMDDRKFAEFFVEKKSLYLEAKQAKIDEAARKIEADKIALEDKKKHDEALEKARKDGEIAAKKKIKENEEKKAAQEKADAELLEGRKKYQNFLIKNGWTEETADQFTTIKSDGKIILYRKVGEFKI